MNIRRIGKFFLTFLFVGMLFFFNHSATADTTVPAPVFYLPLKTDIADISGNNHPVVNNGATIVEDPVKGHSLSFTSNNQSLTVGVASPASFTRSAWVKLSTLNSPGYGFNIMTAEGGSGSYFWISNNTFNAGPPTSWTLRAGHFGGASGPTYVWDNIVFPLETYVHVAFTFDNSTKLYSLYENGVLVSTSTASESPTPSSNITIGNFGGTNGWIGNMSGAGLWNSALTVDQIAAVYNGNVGLGTPVEPDVPAVPVALPVPVFFMPFSGSILDASGNAHTVTNNGGDSIVNDIERGQVLSQATNTQSLIVDASLPASFTKSAWVKLSTTTTDGYGFNIISNQDQDSHFMWVTNTGGLWKLLSGHFGGTGGPVYVSDDQVFSLSTWTHITLTYNSTTKTYTLYKNATPISSAVAADAPRASTKTVVGNFADINGWIGLMDNVGMWNSVLSNEQIKANYNGTNGLENPTAPNPPTNILPSVSSGSVNLSWSAPVSSGGLPINNYLVEYKLSSDSSWSIFQYSASTSTNAVINGLSDDVSYDFRVSAINSIGTSLPSLIANAIPGTPVYYYIFSAGQSLSTGCGSSPQLSTSQPYRNLMFGSGVESTTTPLIPLVESGQGENGSVETPSSGIANGLSAYTTTSRPFIVGLHGHNGTTYAGLAKGTSYYTRGMTQATNAKNYVDSLSSIFTPIGITVVHGEDDYNNGNASSYEGYLRQWQSDYQADINVLVGSTTSLPLFTNQMNTGLTGELAVAELSAHKNNPNKIILVGPKYQYSYISDHLHLTNTDSKYMGEMFAKVMKKVIFEGETWNPLMPRIITRNDNIVTVSYNIPTGNLAIDTTNVAARPNYGFEFTQTGGNSVTITNVDLINNNTEARITLSAIPTGTNQRVRYAWSCPGNYGGYPNCGGANDATRVGGNIRDTDSSLSPAIGSTGLPLYDWSVTFDEPVIKKPIVSNSTSTSITDNAAALGGSIDSIGDDNPTIRGFIYGLTSSYGSTTSEVGNFATGTFSANLTNLKCNTLYHWSSYVVNGAGTTTADDYQFTTASCPVPVSPATSLPVVSYSGSSGGSNAQNRLQNLIEMGNDKLAQDLINQYPDILKKVKTATSSNNNFVLDNESLRKLSLSTRNLVKGAKDNNVKLLQKFLNSSGYIIAKSGAGSPGKETSLFGELTKRALIKFQIDNGIKPSIGYFGQKTRNVINKLIHN